MDFEGAILPEYPRPPGGFRWNQYITREIPRIVTALSWFGKTNGKRLPESGVMFTGFRYWRLMEMGLANQAANQPTETLIGFVMVKFVTFLTCAIVIHWKVVLQKLFIAPSKSLLDYKNTLLGRVL